MLEFVARTLLEALLNSLWQGLIVAAVAAGLTGIALRRSAAGRYAVWYAALVALLFLPVVNLGARLVTPPGLETTPPHILIEGSADVGFGHGAPPFAVPVALLNGHSLPLVAAWLAVVMALLLRIVGSHLALGALKRRSEPPAGVLLDWCRQWLVNFPRGRSAALRCSREVMLPVTAGLHRPAILFPADLPPRLSHEQAYTVWLHEIAHIRRRDDWTNLGQRLVQAVLFFHPVAHWIGRVLRLERELACDEWAIKRTGSPRLYAACLIRLMEVASLAPPTSTVLSVAANRKQISRRIEMLLSRKSSSRSALSHTMSAAFIVILFAASAFLAQLSPVVVPGEAATAPVAVPAGQSAPSPQASPKPIPAPAASPMPQPAPSPAEMHPTQEEIQKLHDEIQQQVRDGINPNIEEIHRLAGELSEKVRTAINPRVRDIQRIAGKIGAQSKSGTVDQEAIRKLESQIREVHEPAIRKAEAEIRQLESRIRAIESSIRPAQARIHELEQQLRETEAQWRAQELRRSAPPAPPQPPAPAERPAPPASPMAPAPPVPPDR